MFILALYFLLLSSEICLESTRSLEMFQGSLSPQTSKTDSKTVIQHVSTQAEMPTATACCGRASSKSARMRHGSLGKTNNAIAVASSTSGTFFKGSSAPVAGNITAVCRVCRKRCIRSTHSVRGSRLLLICCSLDLEELVSAFWRTHVTVDIKAFTFRNERQNGFDGNPANAVQNKHMANTWDSR